MGGEGGCVMREAARKCVQIRIAVGVVNKNEAEVKDWNIRVPRMRVNL